MLELLTKHWLIIVLGCVQSFFWTFALYRVCWVYKQRLEILFWDVKVYEKLSSYGSMIWKIWEWDINKFIKD